MNNEIKIKMNVKLMEDKKGHKSVSCIFPRLENETDEQLYKRAKAEMSKLDLSNDTRYPWRYDEPEDINSTVTQA